MNASSQSTGSSAGMFQEFCFFLKFISKNYFILGSACLFVLSARRAKLSTPVGDV